MKLEGIPTSVHHDHDVYLNIRIGKDTGDVVKDVLVTAGAVSVFAYAAKKTIDLVKWSAVEFIMTSVWKR